MKGKTRIPTGDEPFRWKSPFAALQPAALPPDASTRSSPVTPQAASPVHGKNRGRVDIIRQTAQRSGKTVTVVAGFVGISQAEKEALAKTIQRACGAGGTVKEGRIEIQGDQREAVARILTGAGFRPVFAGG